jgi:hypothetical protein
VPRETRLLDEPFAKPCFNFFLGESTVRSSVFQPASHFVENVEVVLNVLDRAVIGEFLEEQLGVLLGGTHMICNLDSVYTPNCDVVSGESFKTEFPFRHRGIPKLAEFPTQPHAMHLKSAVRFLLVQWRPCNGLHENHCVPGEFAQVDGTLYCGQRMGWLQTGGVVPSGEFAGAR